VTASLVGDRVHPILAGVPASLELDDEVYGDLDLRAGIDVLATARRHADDADQPVLWTQRYGDGRVVYDGFGHDAASIRNPDHARLVTQALQWTLRETPCAR
jgi:type 1 glutamine amidotransferase